MSVAAENFIKSIYLLKSDYGIKASSSILSKQLNISHSAIAEMSRKLALKGWLVYMKYPAINLTQYGKKLALNVIRCHRFWELFLAQVLNISLSHVHKEVEILEHQTSDLLIEKINEYLGNPNFDPHGDPFLMIRENFQQLLIIHCRKHKQGKNI